MFSYGLLHMDTPVLANKQRLTLYQLCTDTRCSLEDLLSGEMDDRDGWWERVNEVHAASMTQS